MGVFDGEARFANAPHASETSGVDADGLMLLEDVVERFEVARATEEVVILGERDEEWLARRGSAPIARRAYGKFR